MKQSYRRPSQKSNPILSPIPDKKSRILGLQHLGVTFREGDHNITKIATPIVTDDLDEKLPTFMKPIDDEDENVDMDDYNTKTDNTLFTNNDHYHYHHHHQQHQHDQIKHIL
ncbi:unnamed protein product [Cunninghamella blakesleeana]